MENWKDIEGYEGIYQVSDMGNVRSIKLHRNLCLSTDKDGYRLISLSKNGKRKTFKVHRLVAQAFIDNPDNKPTVDHINTIKSDNRACNLRWLTQKEQMTENETTKERNKKIGGDKSKKAVETSKKKVLCITTGKVFESTWEAARYYNIKNMSGVSNAANPNCKQKTAGKLDDGTRLMWEYMK